MSGVWEATACKPTLGRYAGRAFSEGLQPRGDGWELTRGLDSR